MTRNVTIPAVAKPCTRDTSNPGANPGATRTNHGVVIASEARRRLDRWTERCEAADVARCADCAFRPGTPANGDRLTSLLVSLCAAHPADTPEGNFCCHHRAEGETCSGFAFVRAEVSP